MPSKLLSTIVFPPPFGAKERERLAIRERDIEPMADHAIGIANGEIVAGESHSRAKALDIADQEPDEKQRANQRSEDAERDFDRGRGACVSMASAVEVPTNG